MIPKVIFDFATLPDFGIQKWILAPFFYYAFLYNENGFTIVLQFL